MRSLLLAVAAVVLTAPIARAQLAPVKAGVYQWSSLRPVGRGRVERLVVTGSTLDLDMLEVRAVTIPSTASADTATAHDSLESFVLVKEGKLGATLNGVTRSLGAGGVALVLPGDRLVVSNTGGTPATYYLFTYRSKAPMSSWTFPFVIIMNSSARCVCVAWLRTPAFTDDQCDSIRRNIAVGRFSTSRRKPTAVGRSVRSV